METFSNSKKYKVYEIQFNLTNTNTLPKGFKGLMFARFVDDIGTSKIISNTYIISHSSLNELQKLYVDVVPAKVREKPMTYNRNTFWLCKKYNANSATLL